MLSICWLHQLIPTEQSFYLLHSEFNCAAAIRTHYQGPLVLLFHCFQCYTSGNSRTDAKELLAWSCDSWLVDLVSDVYFCLNGIPRSSKNNLHMLIFPFSTTLYVYLIKYYSKYIYTYIYNCLYILKIIDEAIMSALWCDSCQVNWQFNLYINVGIIICGCIVFLIALIDFKCISIIYLKTLESMIE